MTSYNRKRLLIVVSLGGAGEMLLPFQKLLCERLSTARDEMPDCLQLKQALRICVCRRTERSAYFEGDAADDILAVFLNGRGE